MNKCLNLFVHTILPFANHALLQWETQSMIFQSNVPLCKRFCWMKTASLASNDGLRLTLDFWYCILKLIVHMKWLYIGRKLFLLLKLHHHAPSLSYKNQTSIHIISMFVLSFQKWLVARITSLSNPTSGSYLTILVDYLLKYTGNLTSSHQLQGFVKLSPAWQCSRSFRPCELAQPVRNLSWRPVKRRWIA